MENGTDRVDCIGQTNGLSDLAGGSGIDFADQWKASPQEKGGTKQKAKNGDCFRQMQLSKIFLGEKNQFGEKHLTVSQELAGRQDKQGRETLCLK